MYSRRIQIISNHKLNKNSSPRHNPLGSYNLLPSVVKFHRHMFLILKFYTHLCREIVKKNCVTLNKVLMIKNSHTLTTVIPFNKSIKIILNKSFCNLYLDVPFVRYESINSLAVCLFLLILQPFNL